MRLEDHPTVQAYRNAAGEESEPTEPVDAGWLKEKALSAGADDVGLIDLKRKAMTVFKDELFSILPETRTVMVLAFRLNADALKSVAHSIVDMEFKLAWIHANETAQRITRLLRKKGIHAINTPAGFPYEASRWPGKMWYTCDKLFAVEAGIGHMGWNRLVLHPQFGASIVLGTVLLAAASDRYDNPIDYNPCLECGLCVKVCPVGAVKRTDDFDFMGCYTHNYRERLGGFQNWIEQVVASRNPKHYRRLVSDDETISMWQNLAIGAQTRCDRCMAICPAGVCGVGEYLNNRKEYIGRYVKPYQQLEETVYVVNKSDAEKHVASTFPAKTAKPVSNGLRPNTVRNFLESLPIAFQPGLSQGLDAVYHFTFTGKESIEATVIIRDKTVEVLDGRVAQADLHVTADSQAWIDFLCREINLIWALVTRAIKIKGPPKLMKSFAACFPG